MAAAGWLNVAPGPREQVAELILHHRPELYAALFTSDGGERRALEWFDHFGADGVEASRFGARALAKFALNNRDQVNMHSAPCMASLHMAAFFQCLSRMLSRKVLWDRRSCSTVMSNRIQKGDLY